MGDPRGFLTHTSRELPQRRPVAVRVHDWREVYEASVDDAVRRQASRCMDCGIPFCNQGCPLGNLIPDWNHQVHLGRWSDASERLHATNNFPEFTGRLCPAPCEGACVLGINQPPVTIKQSEVEIAEHAWAAGDVVAVAPALRTGKRVGVVGSGPSGLAAAQQLTRAGHDVVVYERAERAGGLMRYGIPEFKMEKRVIDRRLAQMRAEGTIFRTSVEVGTDVTAEDLIDDHDAVVLAIGSTVGRDLPIRGREAGGIHLAMEYLPLSNKVQEGALEESPISAAGKSVVIIGGGDTGADCLGTALRQGAAVVHQFEIMERPPDERDPVGNPWPTYPMVYRVSSAHEEGGERVYSVSTKEFLAGDDGDVCGLRAVKVEQRIVDGRPVFEEVPGSEFELACELVLLAMGFVGPQQPGIVDDLGCELDARGNLVRDAGWQSSVPGVFVAGDCGRGQSLIVWAIAEGRSCAAAVDAYLMGDTLLPAPVRPTDRPMA